MKKLLIIYDSQTGNTERIAKCIAKGARTASGVRVILRKIGEPFPLSILNEVDALILGAPAHYGFVTPKTKEFLASLQHAQNTGRIKLEGKFGAAFGSYGWDGGVDIERLAMELEKMGINVVQPALAQASPLSHAPLNEKSIIECHKFGRALAEKISR